VILAGDLERVHQMLHVVGDIGLMRGGGKVGQIKNPDDAALRGERPQLRIGFGARVGMHGRATGVRHDWRAARERKDLAGGGRVGVAEVDGDPEAVHLLDRIAPERREAAASGLHDAGGKR